jgi:hypothetical protein
MTAAVVALAVAVVLLSVLVAGLLRSHAEILKSLHELGAGLEPTASPGPVPVTVEGVMRPGSLNVPESVSGETLDGEVLALSLFGQDTLLAFLSSGCSTCQAFWTAFQSDPPLPQGARLVVVTRDAEEEDPSALQKRRPQHAPLLLSSESWDEFGVPGSPYFALVDATGRLVGEGSGASWPQVLDLLNQGRRTKGPDRDDAVLRTAGIEADHPSLWEQA